MTQPHINKWLEQGIAAAKAGQKQQARTLLQQVVENDPNNETAWLWLGTAMETDAERIKCLKQVLAINPNNQSARKRLVLLEKRAHILAQTNNTFTPTSPPKPQIQYTSYSEFNDVWSQENIELCPYCAYIITQENKFCPGCKRNLYISLYVLDEPKHIGLFVYWLLLLAGIQLLSQIVLFPLGDNRAWVAVQVLFILFTLLAALGIGLRIALAYQLTNFLLGMLSLFTLGRLAYLLTFATTARFSTLLSPESSLDPVITFTILRIIYYFGLVLLVSQLVITMRNLFVSLFSLGEDFEKLVQRVIATVDPSIKTAVGYHQAAKQLAQAGMWASAVLHWQRAAANAPRELTYHRRLAQAYARLGFYERSLNILQGLLPLATKEEQNEIQNLITELQYKLNTSPSSQKPQKQTLDEK